MLLLLGQLYETHWREVKWSAAPSPAGGGPVTSRIPQKLLLELILFNIFISDLDDGAERVFCKFTNDRKLGVADTGDGCTAVQKDLTIEMDRMTLTKGNIKSWSWEGLPVQYMLKIKQLKRDMGAVTDSKLSMISSKDSQQHLGCIRKSVASRLWQVIFPLYSALVRHIWSAVSSSEAPCTRDTWAYWSKFSEGWQRSLRVCSVQPPRGGWMGWDLPWEEGFLSISMTAWLRE